MGRFSLLPITMKLFVACLAFGVAFGGVPSCNIVYDEKCWDEPRQQCHSVQKPFTTTHYEQECHSVQVPMVESVPEQKCHDVPEQKCHTAYETKVDYVHKQKCDLVTEDQCHDAPE